MHAATRAARARLAHELDQHQPGEQAAAWRCREGSKALRAALAAAGQGQPLGDWQVAWLCLLLADSQVRDLAWAGTGRDPAQLRLWSDLTRRAEPELVPAPASLCAFTAWYRGDGVLARVAVQRALAADATYRMALLMRQVLDAGISPQRLGNWPAVAAAWLSGAQDPCSTTGRDTDPAGNDGVDTGPTSGGCDMPRPQGQWWSCPGCGVTIEASQADLIAEHSGRCPTATSSARAPWSPST
jgi:hypothetical protein